MGVGRDGAAEWGARRNSRILFAGLTVSMFGDSVLLLVLGVWTKSLTGSTSMAGLAVLAMTAPAPLAPVFGWVADRFRRRQFLIAGNLASAAALCPLFLVRDHRDVWLLLSVCVLYGVSFIVLDAALGGLLKQVLPEDSLAGVNGRLATVRHGLRLVGPLIGAGLFTVLGPVPMVGLDVASFVLAAAAMAGLRLREPSPPPHPQNWLVEMARGMRHVGAQPALRRAVLALALAALLLGPAETINYAYVDRGLHRPPAFLGVLVTAQALGGVLGGLLVAPVVRRAGELSALACGLLFLAGGMALMVIPVLPLAFVAMPVEGIGLPLLIVPVGILAQRSTPAATLGRVSAVVYMSTNVPQALAIAGSAALVSIVDYRVLLVGMAGSMLVVAAGLWPSWRLTVPARGLPVPPTDEMPPPVFSGRPGNVGPGWEDAYPWRT